MAQKLSLAVGLEQHELTIAPQPDGSFTMQVDEEEHRVVLEQVGEGALHRLTVDGETTEVYLTRGAAGLEVFVGPDAHPVRIHRAAAGAAAEAEVAEGEVLVRAPMTGTVVEVLVAPGDTVAKGDPLLVVVAMKMNNEIKAPVDAGVKEVHVAPDDSVDQGDVLILLEVGDGSE